MPAQLHIAVDVMSGDRGPAVCVPAAIAVARLHSEVRFTLVGREAELVRELGAGTPANVARLDAAEVVEMSDHPRDA
ncbi:MAG: phosphate acyltransferase, partial [Gammaproteobacteria bacterium]|nr:phosphate acyltransferase [Gammaproteobacteria bacterium]